MTRFRSFRGEALAIGAVAGVVALLLGPVLWGGRVPLPDYLPWFGLAEGSPRAAWNPLWFDAMGQYWPWRTLLHDGLREGQIPFWNPYQLGGYAIVGNGQSALFYPPNWLLFALPVTCGFRLTALLHLWLAGLGVYALVRQLGGRPAAALAGAVAFPLSAFMVGWLLLPTLISSAAWLPWALACLERCRAWRDLRWAAGAGGAVALSALAGHPQIFYYVGLTAGLVALVRLGRQPGSLLLFGLVAVAGSLPMVLPLMELAPRSHRPPAHSPEALPAFLQRSLPGMRALTLLVPEAYGTAARGTIDPAAPETILPGVAAGRYWGMDRQGAISPGDDAEFGIFVGVVTLWLVLLALVQGRPAARGFALLAVAALWLAFGQFPVGLLYRWLPGFSAGAGPCRLAVVWCATAATAAGLSVDQLSEARPSRRALLGSLGALMVLWVLAAALSRGAEQRLGLTPLAGAAALVRLLGGSRAVLFLAAGVALALWRPRWLAGLVAIELLGFAWGVNPTCPAVALEQASRRLQTEARPRGNLRSIDPNLPERWGFYRPPMGFQDPPNFATIARRPAVGGYDSLLPALAKDVLFQAAGGQAIAPATNGNMLLLGHVSPDRAPTARGGRARQLTPDGRFGAVGLVAQPSVNRLEITITGPGAVLLRDAPDPGWRAWIGRPGAAPTAGAWTASPYAGADRLARLVPLPSGGTWHLRFIFAPATVRVGVFAGLLTLALLVALAAGGTRPRRVTGTPARGEAPDKTL